MTSWNVAGHKGTVVVEYTVFGDRADGTFDGIDTLTRTSYARKRSPTRMGSRRTRCRSRFTVPEGSGWKVATQLAPHPDGTWTATNMDRMMDSPVELSNLTMVEWKTGNSQFRMALHHRGSAEEAAAYAKAIAAITAEEEGVWGAFPQYDNGQLHVSAGLSAIRERRRHGASQLDGDCRHARLEGRRVADGRPRWRTSSSIREREARPAEVARAVRL
ncbi:MAG: hypothetical protein WDO73_21025 [Ignavibacteriota bacterium]